MPSPHIIDIRWRIASEEKAKRMPLAQPPHRDWYARRLDGEWGVVQHIPDGSGRARFIPTTVAEFEEVNARYRDGARRLSAVIPPHPQTHNPPPCPAAASDPKAFA